MNALIIILVIVIVTSLVTMSVIWQRGIENVNKADLRAFQAENKRQDMETTMRTVIANLEGEIQRQIFAKVEELDNTAAWLNEQIAVVTMRNRMAEKQFSEGIGMVNWANGENVRLHGIKKDAEKLLVNSKKELYEVREASLYLYNHYKVLVEVLNGIVMDGVDYEQAVALLSTANSNLMIIRDNFANHFRKTPEDYVSQRDNISGQNPSGSNFISKFSKN